MTNLNDLAVDSLTIGGQDIPAPTVEALDTNVAISIKSGVVTLDGGVSSAPIEVTLPDPTATTDDHKRLKIVSLTADAHTVTPASPFGNGGAGVAKATWGGAIGDSLSLVAYNGYWYVVNAFNVTLGVA